MATVEALIRGLAICFVVPIAVAAAHKALVLARGAAADEPLIRVRGWTARRPRAAIVAATAAEIAVAVLLVAEPAAGFACMVALTLGYAVALRALRPEEPCHCFGAADPDQDARGAVRRNLAMALLAAAACAALVTGAVGLEPLSSAAGTAALIIAAVSAAPLALRRWGFTAPVTDPGRTSWT